MTSTPELMCGSTTFLVGCVVSAVAGDSNDGVQVPDRTMRRH